MTRAREDLKINNSWGKPSIIGDPKWATGRDGTLFPHVVGLVKLRATDAGSPIKSPATLCITSVERGEHMLCANKIILS